MGFPNRWYLRYFRRPRQLFARRLNLQVHLRVGLILTLYFAMIGVTGSILVLRPELERLFGLKPWQANRLQGSISGIRTVIGNLRAAYPESRIVSIDAPSENDATFVTVLAGPRRIKVACAPSDGKVLGKFPQRRTWLDVIDELHVSLLAIAGLAIPVLAVTGILMYWNGALRRRWKSYVRLSLRRLMSRARITLFIFAQCL